MEIDAFLFDNCILDIVKDVFDDYVSQDYISLQGNLKDKGFDETQIREIKEIYEKHNTFKIYNTAAIINNRIKTKIGNIIKDTVENGNVEVAIKEPRYFSCRYYW